MTSNQTRKAYPTDLNDNEWTVIAPLMPQAKSTGRPRLHSFREVLNAIFYVTKNGCMWKALPHDFPPWKSVYHYFRLWRIDGKWERLNTALREALREKPCGRSLAGEALREKHCGRSKADISSQALPYSTARASKRWKVVRGRGARLR